MAAETGSWPIEPTVYYIFTYYPSNSVAQNPSYTSTLLSTYNDALQQAKNYITSQLNIGVCIIQPITCTVVYPFKPWEDF